MADCTLSSADVSFALQACPNVFDFSLQFEQLIVSILPNSLIVIAAVFALFVDRSYTKYEKINDGPDPEEVGLSKSRNPTYADRHCSILARAGGKFSSWYFFQLNLTACLCLTLVFQDWLHLFAGTPVDYIDPMGY
jgi:hypothetical protein